jgi:hypothetical protein
LFLPRIDEGDRFDASRDQPAGDCAPGAARAEQRHPAAGQHVSLAPRSGDEAGAVEHVAGPAAIALPSQRVDRADAPRRFPEPVGEWDHPRLVRHGDEQAIEIAEPSVPDREVELLGQNLIGSITALVPAAVNACVKVSSERTWAIGLPMIPYSRVAR